MTGIAIPGYDYDVAAPSSITEDELAALKASVLFGDDDVAALAQAGDVLAGQIDAVLDVWYGFVGAHPHLLAYFSTPGGVPLPDYLDRVRPRFGQWILDTCRRPYDARWLAYAEEIGRRHIPPHKNETDGAASVPLVPLRHMVAFIYPITATLRPFLATAGHPDAEVDRMHQAWFKSVTLQVALWLRPYARDGHW
ncbi:MAG: protogloblin ApPgb [Pseudonocardia sp.]|nr:protogloblin ApPgb [Pseudonocardia sp.]